MLSKKRKQKWNAMICKFRNLMSYPQSNIKNVSDLEISWMLFWLWWQQHTCMMTGGRSTLNLSTSFSVNICRLYNRTFLDIHYNISTWCREDIWWDLFFKFFRHFSRHSSLTVWLFKHLTTCHKRGIRCKVKKSCSRVCHLTPINLHTQAVHRCQV